MQKQPLNLGDLITLEGLTKPGEGVVVGLGGKVENVNKLSSDMSDFAKKMEDNKDVRAGDLANLAASMEKALARELSPEDTVKILATLKTRFEKKDKFYKSVEGLNWGDIESRLKASTPEKLWSLNEMERTGGEPDIMGYDKETGEYIFIDCSEESPTGRRNRVYDRESGEILKRDYPDETYKGNVVSMAALMGVDILNEKEYRELQSKGEFDQESWSWIKTPIEIRKTGIALYGDGEDGDVFVGGDEFNAYNPYRSRGWRGVIRF